MNLQYTCVQLPALLLSATFLCAHFRNLSYVAHARVHTSSSSSGTELPSMTESYGLLNKIFPFPSILDAGYPIFDLHLANVLFDVILPSVLGSSL